MIYFSSVKLNMSIQIYPEMMRLDLLRRLRPPHFIDFFTQHGGARLSGTCEWSTRYPNINEWLHSNTIETSRLWLHGGPGTGKSVLASYLLEKKKIKRSQDEVVLYAFCQAQGNVKATASSIVLGFLRQCLDDHWDIIDRNIIRDIRNLIFSEREDYPFPLAKLEPHLLRILGLFAKSW